MVYNYCDFSIAALNGWDGKASLATAFDGLVGCCVGCSFEFTYLSQVGR